jgi:hypothetical protein
MITIGNSPNGLGKPRFLRKINFRNVAKAAFAPHLLVPKKNRGRLIKMAIAPHTLLRKRR